MLLLEGVAVFAAERHHRGHVHLVEGGQHRRGVLCLLQPCGDGAAQARHAHAFLARFRFAWRLRDRRRRGRCRPVQEGQHITLGDAPVLAGSGADGVRRKVVFLDQSGGRRQWLRLGWRTRRARHRPERTRWRMHPRGRVGRGPLRWRRRFGGRRRLRSRGLRLRGRSRRHSAGARLHYGEQCADRHFGALRRGNRGQHAGRWRTHFNRDFVSLEFHQRLIGGHRIALVLHPACDGGRGDAFAQGRDLDLGCHQPIPSAAATRVACSRACTRA